MLDWTSLLQNRISLPYEDKTNRKVRQLCCDRRLRRESCRIPICRKYFEMELHYFNFSASRIRWFWEVPVRALKSLQQHPFYPFSNIGSLINFLFVYRIRSFFALHHSLLPLAHAHRLLKQHTCLSPLMPSLVRVATRYISYISHK